MIDGFRRSGRRSGTPGGWAVIVALSLGFGGCAQIPELGQLPQGRAVADYATDVSFTALAADWPGDGWWRYYADPQLDALIEEALRDAPDMAMAAARLRQAEAASQIAGAPLLPQVGANASATQERQSYNYLMPRSALPQGWNDYGRATLDFAWELDFWGKNRAGLAAATSALYASRAELAQARLSLSAAIATNYAELARLFAALDTADRSVEVRGKTATLFAERFRNGLETKGGVRDAEARLAVADGEQLQLREQIGLQRHRLAALVGAGPDRGLAIARPAIDLQRPYGLPADLAADLLGRRPDVVAARRLVEAQVSRIEQKKAEFYPNINLAGFIGFQSLGLDMLTRNGSQTGSIGPAISLPIFTGWRLTGELRGTAAVYEESVANYNRTVTQALQEVADAGLSQKMLTARLGKAEDAVQAATEAHRVAVNRYEGGLANYLEVLSAEEILLSSLRNRADLRSRTLTLDVALTRALGGGYREPVEVAVSTTNVSE